MRTWYEDGKRTWAWYKAVMDPFVGRCPYCTGDGLLTCACRLDNIFRSGNIDFGAAIHFSGRQNIFQSGKRY